MALNKPYKDIPGTTIFDAEQSRKGYWLNQFCVSLMKPENRQRFKADERAYLDEWPMSEDQKQAVIDRDLNRCIALGGNIYFLARIGATDSLPGQRICPQAYKKACIRIHPESFRNRHHRPCWP